MGDAIDEDLTSLESSARFRSSSLVRQCDSRGATMRRKGTLASGEAKSSSVEPDAMNLPQFKFIVQVRIRNCRILVRCHKL